MKRTHCLVSLVLTILALLGSIFPAYAGDQVPFKGANVALTTSTTFIYPSYLALQQ